MHVCTLWCAMPGGVLRADPQRVAGVLGGVGGAGADVPPQPGGRPARHVAAPRPARGWAGPGPPPAVPRPGGGEPRVEGTSGGGGAREDDFHLCLFCQKVSSSWEKKSPSFPMKYSIFQSLFFSESNFPDIFLRCVFLLCMFSVIFVWTVFLVSFFCGFSLQNTPRIDHFRTFFECKV